MSGGDVYVAGEIGTNIIYWKNGVKTIMGTGWINTTGNLISVYNGDVYVAGYITKDGATAPAYWKNTTQVILPGLARQYAKANSIAVNENGVYVAGTLDDSKGNSAVTVWKDNVATYLAPEAGSSFVSNILVQGNDVYVTGEWSKPNTNVDVYWKNGVANPIPALNSSASITGISVSGNDVYLAGYDVIKYGDTRAVYWKNGVEVFTSPYTIPNTIPYHAAGSDIAVDGSNVYFLDLNGGPYILKMI